MLNVLAISGPIFFIIFLGFVAVKAHLLRSEHARGLGAFVIHFALPALLFKALAHRPAAQLLDLTLVTRYGAGSVMVFILITLVNCINPNKSRLIVWIGFSSLPKIDKRSLCFCVRSL